MVNFIQRRLSLIPQGGFIFTEKGEKLGYIAMVVSPGMQRSVFDGKEIIVKVFQKPFHS